MTPTVREIILVLITGAVTFAGSHYTYKGEKLDADEAFSDRLLARVETLERRLGDMQLLINKQTVMLAQKEAEITRLQVQLGLLETYRDFGPESRVKGIFDLMADLETPAWCKQIIETIDQPARFEMVYLNKWFEFTYGITSEKFVGHTDLDIFPEYLALEYIESDTATLGSKGFEDFIAPRPLPGGVEGPPTRFWKFYHKVENGPELLCGWEVQ